MNHSNPRYRKALAWVRQGAAQNPGIRFTAAIGEARLTGWLEEGVLQFQYCFAEEKGENHEPHL